MPFDLDSLFSFRLVGDPQISPDGARVAFTVTIADRESDENHTAIWAVASDGGEPQQLTFGKRDASPRWSPDGGFLAFLGIREGDERAQVCLLPTTGGEARRLTSVKSGVSGFVWSPDSTRIAFTSSVGTDDRNAPVVIERLGFKADGTGLLRDRRTHVFVVPVAGGDPAQLTSGDFSAAAPAWSPDSSQIAFASAMHEDRDLVPASTIYAVASEGGDPCRITQHGGAAGAPVWSPDGDTMLFIGTLRSGVGHSRLLRAPAAGGAVEQVAPDFDRNAMPGGPAYPGALPRIRPDGTVLFCARERGCTHVFAVPLAGGTPRKIVGGDERIVSGLSMCGDRIAFVATDRGSTGDVRVSAWDGSGERAITDLGAAALRTGEPRTFTAPDGTEIHGWVLRGTSEGPAPTLLDVHGGPHNSWGPAADAAHLYHQTLAEAGWTIVCVNSRGSDGYGESFYSALTGAWGENDLDDFMAVLDTLVAEGASDPVRLAVIGYSYGGFMSNWLTSHTGRFAAAVTGGCLSDLASFYGTSDLGLHLDRHEIGAEPHLDPERVRRLSPITYVNEVGTPTLVLHGENDDRCPVGQSEQWFAALRARRVPVEMVRYPGASHLFILQGRPSHRIDYSRRVHDWVTRWCSGGDD